MLSFVFILLVGALFAGFLGSITGLGGGIVIIPLLTLGLGVDIHYALGTSLISVIATSSGAASTYAKEGLMNIRIGLFLAIATTLGAIMGASIAVYTPTHAIAVIFGIVLLYSAIISFFKKEEAKSVTATEIKAGRLVEFLKAKGSYPTRKGQRQYAVKNLGGGFLIMIIAGALSGLLGIGSGALKVIAMDSVMKTPFKVSTATSNFMIGITAAASAGIYFTRGYMDPVLSMPVVIGVLIGSTTGARIMSKTNTKSVRIVFAIVITVLAFEMIYNGIEKNI